MFVESLHAEVVELLKQVVATPSYSREEADTASLIQEFLRQRGLEVHRLHHNVWVKSTNWRSKRPVVLLNSHHDTVRPNAAWRTDPHEPTIQGDKLVGLGSNDAGGALVSLMAAFLHLHDQPLPFNLIFAATAEEEISGENGVAALLPGLPAIDLGIVGEPTGMRMAIAEKGLMVIDAVASGKSGHAARDEGVNAIDIALRDIQWIHGHEFDRQSDELGAVKATVTQIEAGSQHNVVPAECRFVIDVRTTEQYSNQEVFEILNGSTTSELRARSYRLQPSGISRDHPLVRAGSALGLDCHGSPTLSDQALMPFSTLKIGPGESERSHTAGEFIYLGEIREAIKIYIELLQNLEL